MQNILIFKIIASAIIFTGSLVSALLPYGLTRLAPKITIIRKWYNPTQIVHILDVSQGFAAGVLLAAALMHLLVEGNEMISKALSPPHEEEEHDHHHPYPWVFLCCVLSLLFIYCTEKILESFSHPKRSSTLKQQESVPKDTTLPVNESNAPAATVVAQPDASHTSGDTHVHGIEHLSSKSITKKLIGALVLWMSLVLHSFFEGMGMGALPSEKVFTC